jgi:multidrug efflux pump subunit AcrB
MGPIPKFALMASVLSTSVALTVNPWLSYYLTKDQDSKKIKPKRRKWSIRKIHINILSKFL